jgi:hypothetical protein
MSKKKSSTSSSDIQPPISRKKLNERPIRWLESASPEEIGEALFAVGDEKTVLVAAYLLSRAGPELSHRIDLLTDRCGRDPEGVAKDVVLGAFRSLLGSSGH